MRPFAPRVFLSSSRHHLGVRVDGLHPGGERLGRDSEVPVLAEARRLEFAAFDRPGNRRAMTARERGGLPSRT